MLPMNPPIVWIFGKIAAGKSTIAKELARQLQEEAGYNTVLIEGDEFRKAIHPSLGFSKEDRITNIASAARFAVEMTKQGKLPVCAFVTPMESTRAIIKDVAGDIPVYFIHVVCSDKKLLIDRRQSRGKDITYLKADRDFKLPVDELANYYQIDTATGEYLEKAVGELRWLFAKLGPCRNRTCRSNQEK